MTATPEPAELAFRERVERWEAEFLWEPAARSYPAERAHPEEDSAVRTPFQRDRDRIVHSKAFRRLKHKTQVFIAPEGDHYRTRLTHTLETCCIARTVARALGLNEDLTEAIGLGHDLGHPPFGHIGEEALDEALRERGDDGFRHNVHSLRVVDVLEGEGRGLNLTAPVRDGILNHTGSGSRRRSRAGSCGSSTGSRTSTTTSTTRSAPGCSRRRICRRGRSSCSAPAGRSGSTRWSATSSRRRAPRGEIEQSEEIGMAMLRLRKFMFDNVYLGETARGEHERVQRMLRALFDHYLSHPELVAGALDGDGAALQAVTDYVAGMTDRFAIASFKQLALPAEARL